MQSFTNELKAIEMKLTSAYECQTVVDFFYGRGVWIPKFQDFLQDKPYCMLSMKIWEE